MDPRFIRTCTFATLHTPGYGTRVTLCNGVVPGRQYAMDAVVSMSAFDSDGNYLGESPPFLELGPGELARVDVDAVLHDLSANGSELRDVMGVLHLTPREHVGKTSVEVSKAELMAHTFATDDFVEYFSYDGNVVTGVAYQTGHMNDSRLASTRTTTIQAPKVIVSERVDTVLLLMNLCPDLAYDSEVTLRFAIMDSTGAELVSSSVTVPPFAFRLLSARDVLARAGRRDDFAASGGLGTLFGHASDGSLVPLSMTRNDTTGAIAVDHTLPPVYYVSKWGGELRKQGNARLAQRLFAKDHAKAAP